MTSRSVSDNAQSDLEPVAKLLFNTSAIEGGSSLQLFVYNACASEVTCVVSGGALNSAHSHWNGFFLDF